MVVSKLFIKRLKIFDIEVSIEDAIDFHNNRKLKSTGYKPIEIKDTTDENIINEVIENIIKSMKRKVKHDRKLLKNTLLLICPNIELKSNKYVLKKYKIKKQFIIPAKLIKYINSNTLNIEIKIDFNLGLKLNKGEFINIDCNCCRIIDEFGFNYYLNQNGDHLEYDDIIKLALLED